MTTDTLRVIIDMVDRISSPLSKVEKQLSQLDRKIRATQKLASMGLTFDKNGKIRDATGQFISQQDLVTRRFKQMEDVAAKASGSMRQQFDMNALSLLFFGMALQRFFFGILRSLFNTFQKAEGNTNELAQKTMHLKGAWEFLKFSIWNALNQPVFITFLTNLIETIDKIADWVQQNEELTLKILKLVAALGALGTAMMVFGTLKLGILGLTNMIDDFLGTNLTGITKKYTLPVLLTLAFLITAWDVLNRNGTSVKEDMLMLLAGTAAGASIGFLIGGVPGAVIGGAIGASVSLIISITDIFHEAKKRFTFDDWNSVFKDALFGNRIKFLLSSNPLGFAISYVVSARARLKTSMEKTKVSDLSNVVDEYNNELSALESKRDEISAVEYVVEQDKLSKKYETELGYIEQVNAEQDARKAKIEETTLALDNYTTTVAQANLAEIMSTKTPELLEKFREQIKKLQVPMIRLNEIIAGNDKSVGLFGAFQALHDVINYGTNVVVPGAITASTNLKTQLDIEYETTHQLKLEWEALNRARQGGTGAPVKKSGGDSGSDNDAGSANT